MLVNGITIDFRDADCEASIQTLEVLLTKKSLIIKGDSTHQDRRISRKKLKMVQLNFDE